MKFNWFKYPKLSSSGYVDTWPASSPIVFSSIQCNNRRSHSLFDLRTTKLHKIARQWIDYCGIFYFFIKYLKIRQQHSENDIKPIFIKWADLTMQPLDYHYTNTFDTLFITIIHTVRELDHDGIATSHLEGYNEYDLLLLIAYVVSDYNTNLQDFIMHVTSRIQLDIAALVHTISSYNYKKPQASNYYFLSNILRYLWDKFWESEPEARLEIKGKELMQIPGERKISLSDNNTQLQQLKDYIDRITDDTVYTILSFEVEYNRITQLVDDFANKIGSIERGIRLNKPIKGRCEWERNFWGRWDMFNHLIRRRQIAGQADS